MDEPLGFPSQLDERIPTEARLTTLQKAELARAAEILSETPVEQLFQLASVAHEVDFASTEIIFREHELADAFYVIVRGEVELSSPEHGVREVVGPGRAFGLYSVLTSEPRHATARALQATFAIAIKTDDFYSLLFDSTEVVESILRFSARKCLNPYV